MDPIQVAFVKKPKDFFLNITSHSPDPESSNGTDLLAFKVVQSQVEKTSDKVSVFQYGTSFLPSKENLIQMCIGLKNQKKDPKSDF